MKPSVGFVTETQTLAHTSASDMPRRLSRNRGNFRRLAARRSEPGAILNRAPRRPCERGDGDNARRVAPSFSPSREPDRATPRSWRGLSAAAASLHRHIHRPPAERDIERIAAEQVDHGDEDDNRNAASQRCGVAISSGLPNTTINTTASGTSDAKPSTTPMKRLPAAGRAERYRDELEGQIDGGEPSHVEAEAIRREQAEPPVHFR